MPYNQDLQIFTFILSMSGANRFPGGNGNPGRHPGGYGNQPVYGGQQGGEEDMYNQYACQSYGYDDIARDAYNQGFYNQLNYSNGSPAQPEKTNKNKRPNTKSGMVESSAIFSGSLIQQFPSETQKKNYSTWKSSQLDQVQLARAQQMVGEPNFGISYGDSSGAELGMLDGYKKAAKPPHQSLYQHQAFHDDSSNNDDHLDYKREKQREKNMDTNMSTGAVSNYGNGFSSCPLQSRESAIKGEEHTKQASSKHTKHPNNSTSQRLNPVDVTSAKYDSGRLEVPKGKPPAGKTKKMAALEGISNLADLEMKYDPNMMQVGKTDISATRIPSKQKQKGAGGIKPPQDKSANKHNIHMESTQQKSKKPKDSKSGSSSDPLMKIVESLNLDSAEGAVHEDLDLEDAGATMAVRKADSCNSESYQKEHWASIDKSWATHEKKSTASGTAIHQHSTGAAEEPTTNKQTNGPKKPPIKKDKGSATHSKLGSDSLIEKSETNSNKNARSQKNSQGLDPRIMGTITEGGSKISRGLKGKNNKESSAQMNSLRKLEAKDALEDFKNLREGLYFNDESSPMISFLIHPRQEPKAWLDDYIINGFLITGIVLSVPSLTSVVYVFIDRTHEIYHRHFKTRDGVVSWKNPQLFTNAPCIAILSFMERVELYDNTFVGSQGRCCFMAMENCHLSFTSDVKTIKDWMGYQQIRLLYEPGMIPKIHIQSTSRILAPEDPLCKPTCVPLYFNNKTGELPVRFSHKLAHVDILEGDYCIGVIELLHGKYTIVSQTRHIFFSLLRMAERALEAAEELEAHVCLHNARRFFMEGEKHRQTCILIAPFEPTISLVRFTPEDSVDKAFTPDADKLSKLLLMHDETINPAPILPEA
jgi:hypothetical protein